MSVTRNNESSQQEQTWKEYDRFKEDYERSLKHNKTFPDMVKEIMDEKELTIEKLGEISKIDTRTIYRLRSGKIKNRYGEEVEYIPYLRTIIAFCIACELDMLMTVTLLESQGMSFKRTSKVDYAYCYLIVNCRGKSITECNEVLKNLGIGEQDLLKDDI